MSVRRRGALLVLVAVVAASVAIAAAPAAPARHAAVPERHRPSVERLATLFGQTIPSGPSTGP